MIFIKKLPKIYQNTIDKQINNNKKTCYVNRYYYGVNKVSAKEMTPEEIDSVIDGIFNEIGYSFNIPVIIKTNTKIYETSIITRTNGYLLTLNNNKIRVEDIIFIQRKNP